LPGIGTALRCRNESQTETGAVVVVIWVITGPVRDTAKPGFVKPVAARFVAFAAGYQNDGKKKYEDSRK
jgi:hypothetical protein